MKVKYAKNIFFPPFAIITLVISVIIFCFIVMEFRSETIKKEDYIPIDAVITAVHSKSIEIAYEIGAKEYNKTVSMVTSSDQPGGLKRIYINPDNPEEYFADMTVFFIFGSVFAVLLLIIGTGITIYFTRSIKERKYLKENGTLIECRVKEVNFDGSYRINGKPAMVLNVEASNKNVYQSEPFFGRLVDGIEGRTVSVYLNEDKYFVDVSSL